MLCPVARPNRNDQESTVNRERAGKKVLTETISLQVQVPVGWRAKAQSNTENLATAGKRACTVYIEWAIGR